MLLKLKDLITKHNMKITGVIHVGAHHGEEVALYKELGISPIVLIEPCKPAFDILKSKFHGDPDIILLNFACGNEEGVKDMNVETANTGQSNSLLKPKLHLKHYSNITFDKTEPVIVAKLDVLIAGITVDRVPIPYSTTPFPFNFLNADIQGFEGEMLKGATETLKYIDYIYLEVNDAEVYEGNSTLQQLDAMLSEYYSRVELSMTDANWGDAMWIRKRPHPQPLSKGEGSGAELTLVARGDQKFYDELREIINVRRRVNLDLLSKHIVKINSYHFNACQTSILMAKAWYGKINGLLGFETPYKNDGKRKTVADIEPTAEEATITIPDLHTNVIEFIDYLREQLKSEIKLIPDFYEWNRRVMNDLFERKDIPDTKEAFDNIGQDIPLMQNESSFVYQHLCEARFHLGFALQHIRENAAKV